MNRFHSCHAAVCEATSPRRIAATAVRSILLAGASIILSASPSFAQVETGKVKDTARSQDVVSSTGVSYATGAYSYKLPILSIGAGEFPRSLSYGLWYNSGSARFPNLPWTHNLTVRTSRTLLDDPASTTPNPDGKPHPELQTWLYNIVVGQRSENFEKYGNAQDSSSYMPITKTGSTLTYTGNSYAGFHTYTGSRGEIIKFRPIEDSVARGRGEFWLEPDGTKLTFNYSADTMSVENNLGYALFMESPVQVQTGVQEQEMCVLNLTQHYLPSITACPSGVQTAKVKSSASASAGYGSVSAVTMPDGGINNFTYAVSTRDGVTRSALACIKEVGSSTCSVTNSYDQCDQRMASLPSDEDPSWSGSRDRVVGQVFPSGATMTYSYVSGPGCRDNSRADETDSSNAVTSIQAPYGLVSSFKDPLLRESVFTYTGGNLDVGFPKDTLVASATSPEGDRTEYTYDGRANVTSARKRAKPGSGLADIVTSAAYPVTCTNRVTCNQATSRIDARGNQTDSTYDPVHGGLLTETGPASASGQPRPQTRLSYAQRYAWIANGSGGFMQAASPVWVLTAKSLCKTSAATGNASAPCAVAGDEVRTTYDYGPNSGPNNLLLRGIVEDAGGLNLRNCYGYDNLGRKISETRPRAGLTSCP